MTVITNAATDERRTLEQLLGTVAEAMEADVLVLEMDTPGRRRSPTGASWRIRSPCSPPWPGGRSGDLRDLFGAIAVDNQAARTSGPFLRHERELASYRVGELMTHQPATARARWPLTMAVALMVELGVNRLPVLDDNDQAIGLGQRRRPSDPIRTRRPAQRAATPARLTILG